MIKYIMNFIYFIVASVYRDNSQNYQNHLNSQQMQNYQNHLNSQQMQNYQNHLNDQNNKPLVKEDTKSLYYIKKDGFFYYYILNFFIVNLISFGFLLLFMIISLIIGIIEFITKKSIVNALDLTLPLIGLSFIISFLISIYNFYRCYEFTLFGIFMYILVTLLITVFLFQVILNYRQLKSEIKTLLEDHSINLNKKT